MDLLKQSSESLAGRIRYLELAPLDAGEVGRKRLDALWLRGGFPESLLAASDAASLRWRTDFIRTYLERDIPQLGPRIPAETLRRLWTMLAHQQGGLLNAAALARALAVDGKTVAAYLDLLVDLLLVRRLAPWHGNVRKRLVKSPKVYVRDSGLVHCAAWGRRPRRPAGAPGGRRELGRVGHRVADRARRPAAPRRTSSVPRPAPRSTSCSSCPAIGSRGPSRSSAGWRRSSRRGFQLACETVRPERRLVVYGGAERFPLAKDVEAVSLVGAVRRGCRCVSGFNTRHVRKH